jgi:hypothetical protein
MGITSIRRDWGDNVTIVRIITTDILQTVSTLNYIMSQAANIVAANNGPFTWLANDVVLVNAADGDEFFLISADFNSLLPFGNSNQIVVRITAAQFQGMYATPILLVPAPPANTLIKVNNLALAMTFVTTQYAAGGAVAAQYEATVHGGGVLATTTLAAATVNGLAASTVENLAGASSVVYAAAVGQPVYLSNQTAAFTTGDGTWVATINYSIIPTA